MSCTSKNGMCDREGMRKIHERDMKKVGTLDSSEKTIDTLVDGGQRWPNRKGIRQTCNIWHKRTERPNVGGAYIRSRNDAPPPKGSKGCEVNGQ